MQMMHVWWSLDDVGVRSRRDAVMDRQSTSGCDARAVRSSSVRRRRRRRLDAVAARRQRRPSPSTLRRRRAPRPGRLHRRTGHPTSKVSAAAAGRRSCRGSCGGSWPPPKICRTGQSMFWPPKNVTFFHSKLLLCITAASFASPRMKDLCQKWKVKLIFQGAYRLSGTGIV